jgi:hypothetical protein
MEEFKSKLKVEPLINYNKEFENEELNEEDADKSVFLYRISIFGNMHYIAMGNRKIHSENENVAYYVAYLVYEKKVVSKIGLYEYLIDELSEEEPDFSEGELLLNPKYYKQPHILNTFKLTDIELAENGAAKVVSSEQYLLKEDGTLDLVEEDDSRKLKLIKDVAITSSNTKKRNQLKIILLKDMKLFGLNCVEPQLKGKSSYIPEKLKELKKLTVALINKQGTYIFESLLESEKSYELTELLLFALEINLNIKFLVLDENKRLNSLNLINNYTFSDYISIIKDQIKEYNKDEKSLQRKEVMIMSLLNYNPDRIIFLKKVGKKYTLLSNNDKTITHISELDNKMIKLLRMLYENDDHFYKYDKQLLSLKELFKTIVNQDEQPEPEEKVEELEEPEKSDEEQEDPEPEPSKAAEEQEESEPEPEADPEPSKAAEEPEEELLPEPPKSVTEPEPPKEPEVPVAEPSASKGKSKMSVKDKMALIKQRKKTASAKKE